MVRPLPPGLANRMPDGTYYLEGLNGDGFIWNDGFIWSDAFIWNDTYAWSDTSAIPASVNSWVDQE